MSKKLVENKSTSEVKEVKKVTNTPVLDANETPEETMLINLRNKLAGVAGVTTIGLKTLIVDLAQNKDTVVLAHNTNLSVKFYRDAKEIKIFFTTNEQLELTSNNMNFLIQLRRLIDEAEIALKSGAYTSTGAVEVKGPKNTKTIALGEAIITLYRSNLGHKVDKLKAGEEVTLGHCKYKLI
jgi:hypothetical protein